MSHAPAVSCFCSSSSLSHLQFTLPCITIIHVHPANSKWEGAGREVEGWSRAGLHGVLVLNHNESTEGLGFMEVLFCAFLDGAWGSLLEGAAQVPKGTLIPLSH